jgi:hypothetical protein
MSLAAAIAVRLRGRPVIDKARPPLSGSLVLGSVLLVAFFLVAATIAPQHPVHDLPFFLLTGLIVVSSFTLTVWYSRQLEAVDFGTGARSQNPGASESYGAFRDGGVDPGTTSSGKPAK